MTIFPSTRHMRQALLLNMHRKSRYLRWSNGQSSRVSNAVVLWELRLLMGSIFVDLLTIPFRLAGVPFLDVEYVDMSHAMELPVTIVKENLPKAESFLDVDINNLIQNLQLSLKTGYRNLENVAHQGLHKYEKEPRLNCLVRHFLESIRCFARNAPSHLQKCPIWLRPVLNQLIKTTLAVHIAELRQAHKIDLMAKNLQLNGIFILYWDIPPIP